MEDRRNKCICVGNKDLEPQRVFVGTKDSSWRTLCVVVARRDRIAYSYVTAKSITGCENLEDIVLVVVR